MSDAVIEKFCEVYQQLNKENIYSNNVIFVDAVERIEGLDELQRYFNRLYKNISFCRFDIEQTIVGQGQASVIWTMTFSHQRLKSGKSIEVHGCSHLKFTEKIYYHRDYLDLGEMVYEQLPLLGRVIKLVKRRISQ
jgi:hypothetical protein